MSKKTDEIEIVGKPTTKPDKERMRTRKRVVSKSGKITQSKLRSEREREIIELKATGLSSAKVARAVGVSINTVDRAIAKFKEWFKELENVKDYREARADLVDAAEFKTLKSLMSDEKHEAADLKSLAYTFNVIHKSGRLERGLSTSNTQTIATFIETDIP